MSYRTIIHRSFVALSIAGIGVAAYGAAVPTRAKLGQMMAQLAYEETIATGTPQKPWASADMRAIGKLSMPRLGISYAILDSGTREAMRAGPTLLPQSAALGMPGTSVITAHRDTHFRFLKDVRKGDIVTAAGSDGIMRRYRVNRTEIVDADKFTVPGSLENNALALSTCYPFDSQVQSKQRYVVHAEMANANKE